MKKTRGYKKWLIDTRHYLKNKKREYTKNQCQNIFDKQKQINKKCGK